MTIHPLEPRLRVEAVRQTWAPGHPVVYWRYFLDDRPRAVFAVSRHGARDEPVYRDADTASWRALAYDLDDRPPNGNRDLGRFPSRAAAFLALVDDLAKLLP
jgi:hypothetical protein